jgi:NTP pyrophosphatase (non-canonical NTP hydrolase)
MQDTWSTIGTLVDWLDANSAGRPQDMERLLRINKITEEVGEVAQAAAGALGTNPRKGLSHTWTDVENELVDVILTAMVALRTINPQAQTVFEERVAKVADRSLASGKSPA